MDDQIQAPDTRREPRLKVLGTLNEYQARLYVAIEHWTTAGEVSAGCRS